MALSKSRNVERYPDQQLQTLRVKGTTTIYRGALVGLTSAGYARGLVAGDAFAGIAYPAFLTKGIEKGRIPWHKTFGSRVLCHARRQPL